MKYTLVYLMLLVVALSACQSELTKKGGTPTDGPVINSKLVERSCFINFTKSPTDTQKRVFLLAVGSNTGNLKQANNDAERLKKTLEKRLKIPEKQICFLDDVYRGEFLGALKTLQQISASKDVVIIYYSGHGSCIPNENGVNGRDEVEVYMTQDVEGKGRDFTEKDVVTDKEFIKAVNSLPTEQVISIVDACFSAGMHLDSSLDNAIRKELTKEEQCSKNMWHPENNTTPLKGLLLASSERNKSSYEVNWEWLPWRIKKGGLFTNALLEVLENHQDEVMEMADIFHKVEKLVIESSKKEQHPKIEGKSSEKW